MLLASEILYNNGSIILAMRTRKNLQASRNNELVLTMDKYRSV